MEGGERGAETGDEQGKGSGGGRGEENRMWFCRGDSWEEAGVNTYMRENVESEHRGGNLYWTETCPVGCGLGFETITPPPHPTPHPLGASALAPGRL